MSKIIVGNKCDCKESERQVSEAEGKRLAQSFGIQFVETSAKDNTNIQKMFEMIGLQIKEKLVESDTQGNDKGNSLKLRGIDKGFVKGDGCSC